MQLGTCYLPGWNVALQRWKSPSSRAGKTLNPRRVHPDPVDAASRRDVERLLVNLTEADVGGYFRRPDGAEVFAFRRDDPHTPRTGLVEIALGIDPQAVGNAGLALSAHVDEQLAIRDGPIRLHLVAIDVVIAAAVDVEIFLVG